MAIQLTPSLCRMARIGVRLSQQELSQKAKIATATLGAYERGLSRPHERTLRDIQTVLEEAGVQFLEKNEFGHGLRVSHAS